MSECKTINCPNCNLSLEETFVEQKCPRCQTLIESKFVCGSCHNCADEIHNIKSINILNKLFSMFTFKS